VLSSSFGVRVELRPTRDRWKRLAFGRALLKESREFASFITLRVTGDGHQGIGLSGISRSAFGFRQPAPGSRG
jgi:hypothetical protein